MAAAPGACSAGRRRCRSRIGPGASIGGVEYRHFCLVHGPGRVIQRVGRVVLRPLGVTLGRLHIALVALAVDASLQLLHLGRSVGLERLPLAVRVVSGLVRLAVNGVPRGVGLGLGAATRALICSFVSCREASSDLFRSATLACSASICSDKVTLSPLPRQSGRLQRQVTRPPAANVPPRANDRSPDAPRTRPRGGGVPARTLPTLAGTPQARLGQPILVTGAWARDRGSRPGVIEPKPGNHPAKRSTAPGGHAQRMAHRRGQPEPAVPLLAPIGA